jgi:hypothetical protein
MSSLSTESRKFEKFEKVEATSFGLSVYLFKTSMQVLG